MNQFQHGDVLGLRVEALPEGVKRVKPRGGRFILADGEATGHAHAITATPDIQLYERDGVMYVKCDAPVELTHEEHGAQIIEPGVFEIGQVVEVDPFEDEIRTVMD